MKTIGVGELKAKLSESLRRVKAGEEVVVTERGRPVARLVPFVGAGGREALERLAGEGLVRLRTRAPRPFEPRVKDPRGRLLAALMREREEGR